MKFKTVEEFLDFRKKNSVEKTFEQEVKILDWDFSDVLYSFLGIYTLGLLVYNSEKYTNTGSQIRYKKNDKSYNAYSNNYIENTFNENSELNSNPYLLEFVNHYYELGNLMPIWPGGNVHKGVHSHCFDLPDVYLNRHEKWTNHLVGTYKNANLDKVITSKYKDIKILLTSLDSKESTVQATVNQYNELLNHVNSTIHERTKKLNSLQKIA